MSEAVHKHRWIGLWPWFAAASSGFLVTLCFAPFGQTWLCWIALTPLLAAVWFSGEAARRRWLRDLLLGYVAGLVFFWSVFSWLHTVTISGLILVGAYMAIYFAVWSWLAGLFRPREPRYEPVRLGFVSTPFRSNKLPPEARSRWLSSIHNLGIAFVLASGWAALEWVRGWLFTGWGWNGLGVALHKILPLLQMAEYTGVVGLSFLVAFVNVIAISTTWRFFLETKFRVRRPHFDFTLTLAAIVGLAAYGLRVLQMEGVKQQSLRIAAVQANVPREQKFSLEFQEQTFQLFARLTNVALAVRPPPQLIVWPESSTPQAVLMDPQNYAFVMRTAAKAKTDLLLGTIDADEKHDYNAAILVTNGGEKIQLYRKLHLVPFGEYVPGRNTVPFVARIVGDQVPGDFTQGKEPVVFSLTTDHLTVAPLICFEDTLGELTRQFVLRGANLLVNVTNDGWFLQSAGSQQHLENAIFRCVETGRPMVRAANTGVTCFVNRFGRMTQVLKDARGSTFMQGVLSGSLDIPTDGRLTFYVQHGELFAQICSALTIVLVILRSLQLARRTATAR